jgi:hypothetical protein
MSAFASAGFAYRSGKLTSTKAYSLAGEILSNVFNTKGIDKIDPLAPSLIGNLSMFPPGTIDKATQGFGYNQYIASWGLKGQDTAYIVSLCQAAFHKGDIKYVDEQCR